jgi:hypothetical protein
MSAREPTDQRRALFLLAVLGLGAVIVAGLVIALVVLEIPALVSFVNENFAPGIGLRTAAIIAAIVSFVVLIAFAVVSGDGIVGELPFVIAGFFLFFLFFWIMTAWVF